MRPLAGLFALCFVLLALGAGAGAWWLAGALYGPGPLAEPKTVAIAPGVQPEQTLFYEGVIRHPELFRLLARARGVDRALPAGEYAFPARVPLARALEIVASGAAVQRMLTIPEGLTAHQVAARLNAAPGLTGRAEPPAEGTVLPETYSYHLDEARADVLARMTAAMDAALAEAWAARAPDVPLDSPRAALILASIVEKETAVPAEYARVAGVFANRLARGMPLQSDPTTLYALTGGAPQDGGQGPIGRRLTRADLEVDSPYNTYKYPGLPPGPIACPGRAALQAAVRPEAHDYLYFVADGTGRHAFAHTLAEHNRNVARWRAVRPD